jgi:hypothetical protein
MKKDCAVPMRVIFRLRIATTENRRLIVTWIEALYQSGERRVLAPRTLRPC